MRILFCGQSGYPNNKNATMNRYSSIAKIMAPNNEIIFLNSIPVCDNVLSSEADFDCVNTFRKNDRSENFIKRNFIKFLSPIFVYLTLLKINKEKKIDWVNVYTQYFGVCLYYTILSKLLKFKTILHYVEIRSEFKGRGLLLKLNDFLYDRYAVFLFDRYIPISSFLEKHLKNANANAKSIIVPPVCDFEYFKKISCSKKIDEQYFLYCGYADYIYVIVFVIDYFKK